MQPDTSNEVRLATLIAARKPVPLATLVYIYSLATRDCYINYHEGAKAVYNYLTSEGTIPLSIPVDTYPEIANRNFKVPRLFCSYELSELANIIAPRDKYTDSIAWAEDYNKIRRAIYFILTRDVISYTY